MLQNSIEALDKEVALYPWKFSALPQSPQAKVMQNSRDQKMQKWVLWTYNEIMTTISPSLIMDG